jgi:cytochrome o ubiquinol oxidase operon protein cyoD
MSENNNEHTPTNNHLGSVRSYLIGFALSLVFTIVPYLMVRGQYVEVQTLLLAVLGFALMQMLVQIFFFLHLGRGPKPFYNVIFLLGTAGFIVMVVGASIIIMDNLYRNMSPEEMTTRMAQEENIAELNGKQTGACQGNNSDHTVVIEDSIVRSGHVEAKRCDTLTLKNNDETDRTFIFNMKDSTVSYGGLDEVVVKHGKSKIITLNETGEFSFRDSFDHGTMGSFSVAP